MDSQYKICHFRQKSQGLILISVMLKMLLVFEACPCKKVSLRYILAMTMNVCSTDVCVGTVRRT
jgi:hypothetical protein